MTVSLQFEGSANGGSISTTVYEDTTGDGTANNSETVNGFGNFTLDTLAGGSGNDYWLDVSVTSGSRTSTPTITGATLGTEKVGTLAAESTLNGGSVDVTVYEDSTGDGNADVAETVSLSGGSERIDLYQIEGGTGNDYWLDVSVSSGSRTSTPTVGSLVLETTVGIKAQAATLNLGGQNASITPGGSSIGADVGSASSVAPNASLAAGGASIQAQPVVLSAAGQDAGVSPGAVSITADEATLQITAQNAGRVFDSTTLSGTVTLNGSGVDEATIYCIDTTNESIAEVTTTDQNGDYRVRVDTGDLYHMVVQYEDDQGNQYNDESKPFLAT